MINRKAVNQMDPKPKFPEISGDVEKTQGLGPEVKGRKVIDPRVYKNETRFHRAEEALAVRVGDIHDMAGMLWTVKGVS